MANGGTTSLEAAQGYYTRSGDGGSADEIIGCAQKGVLVTNPFEFENLGKVEAKDGIPYSHRVPPAQSGSKNLLSSTLKDLINEAANKKYSN